MRFRRAGYVGKRDGWVLLTAGGASASGESGTIEATNTTRDGGGGRGRDDEGAVADKEEEEA